MYSFIHNCFFFSFVEVGLGETCPQLDACGTLNSKCNDMNHICVCDSGYYDTDGAVQGGACAASMPIISYAICSNLYNHLLGCNLRVKFLCPWHTR